MTGFSYTEIKYLLTVSETARVLNVSSHTIYKLIQIGQSAIKVSPRKTMITAEELEKYLQNHKRRFLI